MWIYSTWMEKKWALNIFFWKIEMRFRPSGLKWQIFLFQLKEKSGINAHSAKGRCKLWRRASALICGKGTNTSFNISRRSVQPLGSGCVRLGFLSVLMDLLIRDSITDFGTALLPLKNGFNNSRTSNMTVILSIFQVDAALVMLGWYSWMDGWYVANLHCWTNWCLNLSLHLQDLVYVMLEMLRKVRLQVFS